MPHSCNNTRYFSIRKPCGMQNYKFPQKYMACRKKYKAHILKYKPYISKYMACIFAFFRPLKHNNLQKYLSSLFIFRFLQVRTPRFRLSFFQKQSFGLRFTLRETGITIPRSFQARVFLRARQQRLHVPEPRQLHRHR